CNRITSNTPSIHTLMPSPIPLSSSFFFNDPPPTALYTLSLHDALPISALRNPDRRGGRCRSGRVPPPRGRSQRRAARYHHLHLGHHRRAQGSNAHAFQPKFEPDGLVSLPRLQPEGHGHFLSAARARL